MLLKKLSIVIPVYNEVNTILVLLDKVKQVELPRNIQKEIITVDDCSTDDSAKLIQEFIRQNPSQYVKYVKMPYNKGKGAAIHLGIQQATGEFLIIQDADLEYDPADYNSLLIPVLQDRADVVYGSRFMGSKPHRVLFFWHTIGNKFLTLLSNALTNLNFTDMESGYKLFRTDIIKAVTLKERRFGFEPEITAKISKIPSIRIYEVGIAYYGRTYLEGKKIGWRDGIRAVYCIFRYNWFY